MSFAMAEGESYDNLTFYALLVAQDLEEPYRGLLFTLADCEANGQGPELGARYEQLAAIAETCSLDEYERSRWYEVAARIPLSDQHCHHLIGKLQRGEAA